MRKPFFKKSHQKWYVRIDGKDVPLAKTEEDAYRKWQQLRDRQAERGDPKLTVLQLVAAYQRAYKSQTSPERFNAIERYTAKFAEQFGHKRVLDLDRYAVRGWIESLPYSRSTKTLITGIIKQMYKWSVDEEYIGRNPVAALKSEGYDSRHRTVTGAEHRLLVETARRSGKNGSEFALFLIALRCGARPGQVCRVEAKNVVGPTWVFREHKTAKKTKKPLKVFCHPCLQAITQILIQRHPQGPLFRQAHGAAWSPKVIAMKFKNIREKAGVDDEIVPYSYRHTFATEALLSGASTADVAALLGHTSTEMVSRVYGHLDQHTSHLIQVASRALGVNRPGPDSEAGQ